MFSSILKVALAPVDLTVSAAKDLVDVFTLNDEAPEGSETLRAAKRLSDNAKNITKPD